MKVILLQDVKDLGKKDQIVTVSDGYGKNYLIPRKLAKEATTGSINEAREKQKAADAKKEKAKEDAKALAVQLAEKSIVLHVKTGENGKLFGAVSTKDISDAMAEQHNIVIDKKKIELDEPIKTQGVFEVTARIHAGVTAHFKVEVR